MTEAKWCFRGFEDGWLPASGGATGIMGILNATPDSFSDGGQFLDVARALEHALKMIEDGADVIDVGGESSRPGAEPVSCAVELERTVPVIEAIRAHSDICISIDTVKADVARAAIDAGANIVNDISAGRFDKDMFTVVRSTNAGLILMHMRGSPKTMQDGDLRSDSIVADVTSFFQTRVSAALRSGVHEVQIALDPGIGFGKTFEQNFALCRALRTMTQMGRPLVFGMSRKSSLGTLTGRPVMERSAASLAADLWAMNQGALLVRVHDVRQTVDGFKVWQEMKGI